MKKTFTVLAVIVSWAVFLVWEIVVHQWLKSAESPIPRLDLVLILPSLIGITIYQLLKIKEENIEKP